jgi:hypothetical protein
LFEDKPQSANDAWRKLHSDPLLMIRQREQEALAKIKNNPVKMAMIRKSVSLFFVHNYVFLFGYYCISLRSLALVDWVLGQRYTSSRLHSECLIIIRCKST